MKVQVMEKKLREKELPGRKDPVEAVRRRLNVTRNYWKSQRSSSRHGVEMKARWLGRVQQKAAGEPKRRSEAGVQEQGVAVEAPRRVLVKSEHPGGPATMGWRRQTRWGAQK